MGEDKYFKTFTNCIIVKGMNRSIIVDIQRENYIVIPNELEEIFSCLNSKLSIEEVVVLYGEQNRRVINQYIDYMLQNDLGIITSYEEFDLFIDMDLNFEMPNFISNAIIEISEYNINNIEIVFKSIEKLFCKNFQFISYDYIDVKSLKKILAFASELRLKGLELVLKFSREIFDFIEREEKNSQIISKIIFHDSKKNIRPVTDEFSYNVEWVNYPIYNFMHCGTVNKKDFENVNKPKVLESLNYNSCLHKKIAIDKDGNIKNCPAIKQNFGNVKENSLMVTLDHPEFKKYWNITKDQIEVCKDCEFRHICTDCRAYIEDPDNMYSKPLKCGYNPYTNIWEEWSTNSLKQKAINFYGMQELIKKDA